MFRILVIFLLITSCAKKREAVAGDITGDGQVARCRIAFHECESIDPPLCTYVGHGVGWYAIDYGVWVEGSTCDSTDN